MATKIDGDSVHSEHLFRTPTTTTINNTSNVTYTAAQVLGGVINRDPNGADREDNTPTAASIVSAMVAKNSACVVDSSFRFILSNTSSGTELLDFEGGTGVTIKGQPRLGAGRSINIVVAITNATSGSEAVTFYLITNSIVKKNITVPATTQNTTYDEYDIYTVTSIPQGNKTDCKHIFTGLPTVQTGQAWIVEMDTWSNYPTGRLRFVLGASSLGTTDKKDRVIQFLINGNTSTGTSTPYNYGWSSGYGNSVATAYSSTSNPFSGVWYLILEKVTSSTTRVTITTSLAGSTTPFYQHTYTDQAPQFNSVIDQIEIDSVSNAQFNVFVLQTAPWDNNYP